MLRHESLKDKDVFLYNHPTVSRLTKAIAPHYHLLPGPHSDFPNCPILISNSSFFKIIYLNSICPPTCGRVYISTQLLKSGPRVTLPGEPLLPRRPWEQRWPCPARLPTGSPWPSSYLLTYTMSLLLDFCDLRGAACSDPQNPAQYLARN